MKEKFDLNSFINGITNDYLYGLTYINQTPYAPFIYVQDCLFISKFEVLEEIIMSMEDFPKDPDVHNYLARYCINNNIYVKSISPSIIDYFVLRSVHRNIMDYDFETLRNKGLEWYNMKHSCCL
jgi:hypothetical protein